MNQLEYNLKIEPWNYPETYRSLLVETIGRLPRKVQEKICDDGPVFILVTGKPPSGDCELRRYDGNSPFILLNFTGVKVTGRTMRRLQTVIAHEIAHFILKHW